MLDQPHSKIPVKVVSIKDYKGIHRVEIMLDVHSYLKKDIDVENQLKQFKKQYELTINKAKQLISDARKQKESALTYWKIGRLLQDFLNYPGHKFRVTNYRSAFEREIDLTDSVIGLLLDFANFFSQKEVDNRVPIGLYYELVRKARRLQKIGKLQDVKANLSQMADNGDLPDAKKYRAILTQTVRRESVS